MLRAIQDSAVFGERLKGARIAKGLSMLELATHVGVSKVCIWKWETGQMLPSPNRIEKIASALGTSVEAVTRGHPLRAGRKLPATSFGERLALLREAAKLSVAELSARVGVSKMCIWKWENGRSHPRPEALPKLAEALGTSISMLAHGNSQHARVPNEFTLLLQRHLDARNRKAPTPATGSTDH